MAFYKKIQKKINSKWYPQSVTVGKPVTTDEIAERLSLISTVSPGDTYAVVKNLAAVMSDLMANGRTVKLEGLGTFYYTASSAGNGVATAKEVNANQITTVRVRFIPETHKVGNNKQMTRALVDSGIFWEELTATPTDPGAGGGDKPGEGEVDDPLG